MNEPEHHRREISSKNLVLAILLNIGITLAEAIGGIISGSMSLMSDATHNFSDVISLVISWFANRLSKEEPPKSRLSDSGVLKFFQHSLTPPH